MKKYTCIQVGHHKDIGPTIRDAQAKGWRLHTYQAAQSAQHSINHYLLFESIHDTQPNTAWSHDSYGQSEV
jgi:hypothetical protein